MEWLGRSVSGPPGWGLAVALGVAEMFSLDLILIMLAVGAVVGVVAAWSASPVVLQVLAAVAGLGRRCSPWSAPAWSSGCTTGPTWCTGHDKLVGQQGVVTEELSAAQPRPGEARPVRSGRPARTTRT